MLGATACRIMAPMSSNSWAVSGKLRRNQPNFFAPLELLHHLPDAIVEAVEIGDDAAWVPA